MDISINKHYYFTFKEAVSGSKYLTDPNSTVETSFSSLNGIYFVDRAIVYKDIIEQDIDLTETLLKNISIPNGIAEIKDGVAVDKQALLDSFIGDYLNDVFYKLISTEDESELWVPESLIAAYPNPNVKEYHKVMISTDLGVFDDAPTVMIIQDIIASVIKAKIGTRKFFKIDNSITDYTSWTNNSAVSKSLSIACSDFPYFKIVIGGTDAGVFAGTYIRSQTDFVSGDPIIWYLESDTVQGANSKCIVFSKKLETTPTYKWYIGTRTSNDGFTIAFKSATASAQSTLSLVQLDPSVTLSIYGTKWLTKEQYETILETRATAKQDVPEPDNDGSIINYVDAYKTTKKLLEKANERLAALESLLVYKVNGE